MYDYVSIHGYGMGPLHLLVLAAVSSYPFGSCSRRLDTRMVQRSHGAAAYQPDRPLRSRLFRLAVAPHEAHDHHLMRDAMETTPKIITIHHGPSRSRSMTRAAC